LESRRRPAAECPDKLDELQRGLPSEEIASAEANYHQAQATGKTQSAATVAKTYDSPKQPTLTTKPRFRERQVTAPSAPSSRFLDVRPGDLIAPNTPVPLLLEKDQIYVRIYIPETEIAASSLAKKPKFASILFPNTAFDGLVRTDQQQAEFPAAQCANPRRARPPGHWHKNPHQ